MNVSRFIFTLSWMSSYLISYSHWKLNSKEFKNSKEIFTIDLKSVWFWFDIGCQHFFCITWTLIYLHIDPIWYSPNHKHVLWGQDKGKNKVIYADHSSWTLLTFFELVICLIWNSLLLLLRVSIYFPLLGYSQLQHLWKTTYLLEKIWGTCIR